MRPAVVVEADPVADDAAGVLQRLEAVPVCALLLQGSNDAFHHAVLLRRVTLPRFHVHQIVGNFLMNGGRDGKEGVGSESAVHGGVQD